MTQTSQLLTSPTLTTRRFIPSPKKEYASLFWVSRLLWLFRISLLGLINILAIAYVLWASQLPWLATRMLDMGLKHVLATRKVYLGLIIIVAVAHFYWVSQLFWLSHLKVGPHFTIGSQKLIGPHWFDGYRTETLDLTFFLASILCRRLAVYNVCVPASQTRRIYQQAGQLTVDRSPISGLKIVLPPFLWLCFWRGAWCIPS